MILSAPQIILISGELVGVDISRAADVGQLHELVAESIGTFKPCVSLIQQCLNMSDEVAISDVTREESITAVINGLHDYCLKLTEVDSLISEAEKRLAKNCCRYRPLSVKLHRWPQISAVYALVYPRLCAECTAGVENRTRSQYLNGVFLSGTSVLCASDVWNPSLFTGVTDRLSGA